MYEEVIEKIRDFYKEHPEATAEVFEGDILKLKNSFLSIFFAKEIKGADIDKHAQVVIDNKNPIRILEFAYEVEGANLKQLGDAIIDGKNPEWNFEFAFE